MNQKQIGIILIIIGVVIAGFTVMFKIEADKVVNLMVADDGTCFLEDGTCLHSQNNNILLVGWILAAALIILGIYLSVFDKTQQALAQHQVIVSSALEESKKKDEFGAYIAGFPKEEQDILKVIKEEEGITQSTLRYKVGMSKTQLSLVLKSLEKREIISRKAEGKTNKLFLIKKF